MIIYPLPAIELDDKTLSKQIKTIAQVLNNVYYKVVYLKNKGVKPIMRPKRVANTMTKWACECRANYLNLVERVAVTVTVTSQHRHIFALISLCIDEFYQLKYLIYIVFFPNCEVSMRRRHLSSFVPLVFPKIP